MIIYFETMPEKVLEHFNGGEKALNAKMYVDQNNKILHGRLEPGASIGLHTHDTSSETIFVVSGSGTVLIDGGQEPVHAGECHYCPKGHAHSLINTGTEDLVFNAVVPQQ